MYEGSQESSLSILPITLDNRNKARGRRVYMPQVCLKDKGGKVADRIIELAFGTKYASRRNSIVKHFMIIFLIFMAGQVVRGLLT